MKYPIDIDREREAVTALIRAFAATELSLTGMVVFCIAVTTITAQKANLESPPISAIVMAIKIHQEVVAKFGVEFEVEFDGEMKNDTETLAAHMEQTVADLQNIAKSNLKH